MSLCTDPTRGVECRSLALSQSHLLPVLCHALWDGPAEQGGGTEGHTAGSPNPIHAALLGSPHGGGTTAPGVPRGRRHVRRPAPSGVAAMFPRSRPLRGRRHLSAPPPRCRRIMTGRRTRCRRPAPLSPKGPRRCPTPSTTSSPHSTMSLTRPSP